MSEKESFHFHFVNHTTPWLGLIYDYESGTRIEVNREKENIEEALFRTQGELIASYRVEKDSEPFLQLYEPSPDVDLLLFAEKVKEIYSLIPQIPVYLRKGFSESPEELLEKVESLADKLDFDRPNTIDISGLENLRY